MSTIELQNTSDKIKVSCGEVHWNPAAYRCHVAIVKECDETFSAIVVNLPGVGSCGDTEEDAIVNVRQAVLAAVESFQAAGDPIPWLDPCIENYAASIPEGSKHFWMVVHA